MRRTKVEKRKIYFKVALILGLLMGWTVMFIDLEVMMNNDKITLWVHAPSTLEKGESFEIVVEAWDMFERLAGAYDKEISFSLESYDYSTFATLIASVSLPLTYTFTSNFIWRGIIPAYKVRGADNGKKAFEAVINTPGIHYIVIRETETGNIYRSNPIIVMENKPSKSLYWGDIHGHTLLSDGSGSAEESYEFARDISHLDFAALTDHSEHFPRLGEIDLFNIFQSYIDVTNSYNDLGKFITLVGLEWTPNYIVWGNDLSSGHYNVYFKGDTMPFFSTLTHKNPDELFSFIRENTDDEFISWMHHTNNGQFHSDFGFYDPSISTLIEIYSIHGSSETIGEDNYYRQNAKVTTPGYSVRDALKMGRKFGFMASGDNHDGRLGHSISHTRASAFNQYPYTLSGYRMGHPHPNGLTGIFTSDLSRDNVFDSLQDRSCFATTWVNRPYINFSINGTTVGVNDSTFYVPALNSWREINVTICADGVSMTSSTTSTIKKVDIFKNSDTLWKTYSPNTALFKINEFDNDTITGANYTDYIQKDGQYYINEHSLKPIADPEGELNSGGFDYYYVRVLDSNDAAAWIGPIWVGLNP